MQTKCFKIASVLFDKEHYKCFVDTLMKLKNISTQLCLCFIDAELNQPICDEEKVRSLFEMVIPKNGAANWNLWLEYCKFELKRKNLSNLNSVYWRAKKMLDDPTEFIERFEQMKQQNK